MDIPKIVALEPEIFGFGTGPQPVVVNCVMGTLTMSYGTASIYLDSGEEVSFDELAAANRAYWDAFAVRIPQHSGSLRSRKDSDMVQR